MRNRFLPFAATASMLCASAHAAASSQKVDFNRDIRPILSDTCFKCHGPDPKHVKGGLRLDLREVATKPAKSGRTAIIAKKPSQSELVRRLTTKDPDDLMPPAETGKKLTSQQIELFKRWIEQGAEYQMHWAYQPVAKPVVPAVKAKERVRNPIDNFALAKLEAQKLKPQPEADPVTLIRRLSFDLTGLPPKPEEVELFVRAFSPAPSLPRAPASASAAEKGRKGEREAAAVEALMDRLLASPHYGERMAMYWLDLVRYADTRGYHGDQHQSITPYRDYVINAFNSNKRFDVFTAEQLAGDLFPEASQEQRVASGYNKLLMTTEEGGAQPKEYTAKYAADRVRNASVVWLGSTMGCAECHDHKYDPFTQRDFYSFASFFSDVKETAVGGLETVPLPTAEQKANLDAADKQIAAVEKSIREAVAKAKYEEPEPLPLPAPKDEPKDATSAKRPPPKPDLPAASQRAWEAKVKAETKSAVPKPVVDAIKVADDKRTDAQRKTIREHYVEFVWGGSRATFDPLHKQLNEAKAARAAVDAKVVRTMMTASSEPRMMRILPRGNWLSDDGEIVQPALPAFLGKLDAKGRATRLDLAKWMTAPDNPLVARVFVNRAWKLMFGRGIVTTLEDFGRQGTHPSHPELLDWLAQDFIASGWDVKRLMKLIATSDTYRRTSRDTPELRQKDPYNAQLARQGRFRIDAEMVRDNALAVAGLLNLSVGGPSAKPYQPPGYWSYLNFPKREWQNDSGDGLYRRGVYTYWCRTFLHPSLAAFDASTREECVAERVRSNTPQQALVLLNDPTYVEAARTFAERIVREGGQDAKSRIEFAYRAALSRKPLPDELKLLTELQSKHHQQYATDKAAVDELLKSGGKPAAKDLDATELASWTSVARTILNLHETITRN
ncbi:MAG: DUF1553 domain-containing protein [Verrucomicrobia bacterium]|nr:DUF1553 domain-containing protein [Verrucomicrobiota bacterium]